jgi:serine/threonine protein kinase/tetratricopeptide (TPR) repeat protein
MNEETLFHLALESPPGERAAFLERTCGDEALRRRVEALLHAHESPEGFLQGPALTLAASEETDGPGPSDGPAPGVGDGVGAYKLLQKLGEGGMGTVWVAEQEQPVRRRVALKLIKPGMGSAQVLRRFEQERQALALMDHTHIARAIDAGTTADGRPYFVMELVKGVPITRYCDELHLPIRERLELFIPVCQAIQHAHQKGIIHRDVKPSNVLVSVQDGRPVPKVIDFGVAKALHQPLADGSLYTEVGQVVGTLEYMTPEQAELSALDVDTRADVYGLGVLLYELLTGTTPLDRKSLRRAGYAEVLRRVRDEEPPKPSTRLSESQETLAAAAARRRTDPGRLAKEVRGDLDWIVMRCLEKDRTRRYETASALARDVERYLHDEPVEASPPGAGYRLRKLLRKHRAAVGTAAAFVLLLLAAVGISAGLAVRATEAEAKARDKERLALEERDAKEQARREAEAAQRKQADAVAGLLESVFRGLDPRDPGQGLKGALVSRLDKVAADVAQEYAGEPLLLARMRAALGETQLGLGEPGKAVMLLLQTLEARRALLGPDHRDTLESMIQLGRAYQAVGAWKLAEQLHREALPKCRAALGPDHRLTLQCTSALADALRVTARPAESLELLEQALRRQEATLGPDHPDTLTTRSNLALTYLSVGRHAEAAAALERVLAGRTRVLGADHPDTLGSMTDLAIACRATGQLSRALELLQKALDGQRAKLGTDHPYTLNTMNNLALARQAVGQNDQALALLRQALDRRRAKLGLDHPDTLVTTSHLAGAYYGAGEKAKAVALWQEAAAGMRRVFGAAHPNTQHCLSNLAVAHRDAGHPEKALPLLREVAQGYVTRLGPDHPLSLRARLSAFAAELGVTRSEEARRRFREDLAELRKRRGADGPRLADDLTWVGADLVKYGQPAEAEPLLREGLALNTKGRPDAWDTFQARALLGDALLGQGKYAEVEPLLLQGYERISRLGPRASPAVRSHQTEVLQRLVRLYEATDQKEKAAEWRKRLEQAKAAAKKPTP